MSNQVEKNRGENLAKLTEAPKFRKALGILLNRTTGTVVSMATGLAPVEDDVARDIERVLELPENFLDNPVFEGSTPPQSFEILERIIKSGAKPANFNPKPTAVVPPPPPEPVTPPAPVAAVEPEVKEAPPVKAPPVELEDKPRPQSNAPKLSARKLKLLQQTLMQDPRAAEKLGLAPVGKGEPLADAAGESQTAPFTAGAAQLDAASISEEFLTKHFEALAQAQAQLLQETHDALAHQKRVHKEHIEAGMQLCQDFATLAHLWRQQAINQKAQNEACAAMTARMGSFLTLSAKDADS